MTQTLLRIVRAKAVGGEPRRGRSRKARGRVRIEERWRFEVLEATS